MPTTMTPPTPRAAAPARFACSSNASEPAAVTPVAVIAVACELAVPFWHPARQRPRLRLLDGDPDREEAPRSRTQGRRGSRRGAGSHTLNREQDPSSNGAQPNTPKPPADATSPTGTTEEGRPCRDLTFHPSPRDLLLGVNIEQFDRRPSASASCCHAPASSIASRRRHSTRRAAASGAARGRPSTG